MTDETLVDWMLRVCSAQSLLYPSPLSYSSVQLQMSMPGSAWGGQGPNPKAQLSTVGPWRQPRVMGAAVMVAVKANQTPLFVMWLLLNSGPWSLSSPVLTPTVQVQIEA